MHIFCCVNCLFLCLSFNLVVQEKHNLHVMSEDKFAGNGVNSTACFCVLKLPVYCHLPCTQGVCCTVFCVLRLSSPQAPRILFCASHLATGAMDYRLRYHIWYWVGYSIWTRVVKLAWQEFYTLSHLPCPESCILIYESEVILQKAFSLQD